MISVATAKKIINENILPLPAIEVALDQAHGMCVAQDIYAKVDIPAFPQSSMDGYAFAFNSWMNNPLKINGEIPAGFNKAIDLLPGEAVRIFTGAPVPPGADTVVMQEKVQTENGHLLITDTQIKPGINVRPTGSEIKAGELALPAGSTISPAAIGFLAGIGVTYLKVFAKPMVTIIVTGRELQQPGQPLQYGQVYESNSVMLTAALQQLGIATIKVVWADDDLQLLTNILDAAIYQSDVVLLTGGISVGDYDFVLQACNHCGVTQLFHRIQQRPGKPLYFGKKNEQLIFGLPGNPSSVLTCFYQYVLPALYKLYNNGHSIETRQVPLATAYNKPVGITHFLKGWFDGEKAMPLTAQESYKLNSFAKANCLIEIAAATEMCQADEAVIIYLLPA